MAGSSELGLLCKRCSHAFYVHGGEQWPRCKVCACEAYVAPSRPQSSIAQADSVNHPAHYTQGGIEVIDAIEAWELGFHLGNVVKYVARAAHKGRLLEDLKKARWYLDRAIQRLEKKEGT